MYNDKYMLRQQTIRHYLLGTVRRGAYRITHNQRCAIQYLLMMSGVTLVILALMWGTEIWVLLSNIVFTLLWAAIGVVAVGLCGYIPGSWAMYRDLTRAGVVNYAGEAPLLIDKYTTADGITVLAFWIKGYPLDLWIENQAKIESALNVSVLSIRQGADNQTYVLRTVPARQAFADGDMIEWQDSYRPDKATVLALGVDAAGIQASIDLAKVPHWLIGAATGCGKTQLLLLLLHQFHLHDYIIYLADFKGVDYPAEYQVEGHYATEPAQLLDMLSSITAELTRRRNLLTDSGCNHLDVYNTTHDVKLRRIIVALDETSMILDSTGRGKEEKAKIAEILNHLLTIGRLGRAMGIHLIVATQRPDVASVPGPLKAQLDGRICGHCADAQSSIVVLDDGSAAKLPAVPGRFLLRDGSGTDKTIQAYYYRPKTPLELFGDLPEGWYDDYLQMMGEADDNG